MSISKIDPAGLDIGQIGGRRNLIINGAMQVAQRGTSATVSDGSNEGYSTVDRWFLNMNAGIGGSVTFSQSTDAPDGFAYSVKLQCASTDTPSGTEAVELKQHFEGQDLQQLAFGTSEAKTVTLSWWMKTETTTDPISVRLIADPLGTPYNAVQSVTPTTSWAKYTATFTGSTGAAIANNNSREFDVSFVVAGSSSGTYAVASDTNFTTTRSDYVNDIGNLLSNVSNAIYITGVQLEVGTVATPFEHRSFGEELALCQRYYEILRADQGSYGLIGFYRAVSDYRTIWQFKVTKRALPSLSGGDWFAGPTASYSGLDCAKYYHTSDFYSQDTLVADAEL